MASDYRKGLLQFFLDEASEHLQKLEEGFLRLEGGDTSPSLLDELFRSAHTLKGSAALVKLSVTSEVAHRLEDTLEALKEGRIEPSRALVDALLFSLDHMKDLVSRAQSDEAEPKEVVGEVEEALARAAAAEVEAEADAAEGESEALEATRPAEEIGERPPAEEVEEPAQVERRTPGRRREDVDVLTAGVIKIGTENLEALMNLLGEITIAKNHLVGQIDVVDRMRGETEFAGRRLIQEVEAFADRYAYSLPEHVKYADPLLSEFMELEFDRYDELNLFARKLQEITNDINEALRSLSEFFVGFTAGVRTMDRMIVEMKEEFSNARMVEASHLFRRFTRSVRDLSAQTGKPIKFLVSGGETLLDRVVYDGLFDPLLHIIRNSVSHGIESPEERKALGKAEEGTILLSARREGNTVVIDVRDDGRGILFDKVRARAVERQLIGPDEKVTPLGLLQFLFAPGFSTAEATDMTSGRGVGLDVVKERLAQLNGTINVLTKKGRGTIFRLRLPLSLVIINVVRFKVGHQEFVIPSSLVAEIAEIPSTGPEDLETVTIRDSEVPATDMNTVLGIHRTVSFPKRYALVTQTSGARTALLVDEVLGQEDTVIKPFGAFLKDIRFYSGTSVAGDGSLRLVVNPTWIVEGTGRMARTVETLRHEERSAEPTVLVVDDSLSVRKYAAMVLEANGIKAPTASNGLEALDVLDQSHVDVIVTDLEMPVMHGYELIGELKRRGILRLIPVVVLTSRGGDQHREKAFQLGASDYLIKPFEEESLVATVRRHLKNRHLA